MRIGLLLPNSTYVPRLAADLRRQLLAGLGPDGAKIEITAKACGFNHQADQVRAAIEHMVMVDLVDLVVAPLNPGLLPDISGLFSGQETPLVMLTLGEDICQHDTSPPWVFQVSFNLWQSVWATAYHAVMAAGPNLAILSGLHESGYGITFAAQLGAESAGAPPVFLQPLGMSPSSDEAAFQISDLLTLGPDSVLFLMAEEELTLMTESWSGECPVFGLPPKQIQPSPIASAVRLPRQAISGWDPTAAGMAALLTQRTVDAPGQALHAYHVLAFEAGLLIADALQSVAGSVHDRHGFQSALAAARANGPRGNLYFDAETLQTTCPQHLLTVSPMGRAEGAIVVSRADIPHALLAEQIDLTRKKIGKQGWLNPMYCA